MLFGFHANESVPLDSLHEDAVSLGLSVCPVLAHVVALQVHNSCTLYTTVHLVHKCSTAHLVVCPLHVAALLLHLVHECSTTQSLCCPPRRRRKVGVECLSAGSTLPPGILHFVHKCSTAITAYLVRVIRLVRILHLYVNTLLILNDCIAHINSVPPRQVYYTWYIKRSTTYLACLLYTSPSPRD